MRTWALLLLLFATIAGKKVVITQQGYELSIDPQVADLGSNAGAGQFGVAAPKVLQGRDAGAAVKEDRIESVR